MLFFVLVDQIHHRRGECFGQVLSGGKKEKVEIPFVLSSMLATRLGLAGLHTYLFISCSACLWPWTTPCCDLALAFPFHICDFGFYLGAPKHVGCGMMEMMRDEMKL